MKREGNMILQKFKNHRTKDLIDSKGDKALISKLKKNDNND
jgi:hypothetical protein